MMVGPQAIGHEPERVAPFLRHHVHHRAVGVDLGRDAARLQHHLLDHRRVDLVAAVAGAVLDAHAVEVHLRAALAVIGAGLGEVAAPDVGDPGEPWRERDQRVDMFGAGRQRLEQFLRRDVCLRTFWVSTSGVCPLTVMVSSSDPTRRSALTFAVNPAESSMPSRITVVKPGSVKVTV